MDIVYILLTLLFFGASFGLIIVCEWLMEEGK